MPRAACLVLALIVGSTAIADDVTLDSVPPVVVQTMPAAGTADVDPQTTEIRVTFSKTMRDGAWSWAMIDEAHFPRMDGQPKFSADRRTCVLPVDLEPGRTYAVWINSEKLRNFADPDGRPAVPYLLVFRTAAK